MIAAGPDPAREISARGVANREIPSPRALIPGCPHPARTHPIYPIGQVLTCPNRPQLIADHPPTAARRTGAAAAGSMRSSARERGDHRPQNVMKITFHSRVSGTPPIGHRITRSGGTGQHAECCVFSFC